jgi:TonB-dependent receptor
VGYHVSGDYENVEEAGLLRQTGGDPHPSRIVTHAASSGCGGIIDTEIFHRLQGDALKTSPIRRSIVPSLIVLCLVAGTVRAGPTGKIAGKVTDRTSNEPLPGVNVFLVGTSFGASTDISGMFTISVAPAGVHRVKASCIGYRPVEDSTVEVTEGQTTTINFALEAVAVEATGVVVTAQASGQDRAINQQLTAAQITNVVSAARIQELPDANAAESVGRLPGVSLLRNGGEGNQIVIRGLEPKYNAITVDGVRMATSGSNDRSADLSMISPYSLDNIEIIKSTTPDLDPDVLGGTVNFRLKEARGEKPGLGISLLAQGGYTGLSDAYNKYNNYRYVGSVEGRFFESSLGVFAQGDVERRNLASNEFGGSYDHPGNSTVDYLTSGLNLHDVLRDRRRGNGTLVMDYKLPEGKIILSNFFSSGVTDIHNRGESFTIATNLHNYTLGYSNSTLNNITNALEVEQQLPFVRAKARFSHSYAETKAPGDWTVGFQHLDQNLSQFNNVGNGDPRSIPPAVRNVPDSTYLSSLVTNNSFSKERALSASLDLDAPFSLSDFMSGLIKFGGKYRHQTRSYDYQQSGGQGLGLVSARFVDSLIASHFGLGNQYGTSIPLTPFLDPDFSYGTFLNGDYRMALPLHAGMMADMVDFIKSKAALLAQRNDFSYFNDYYNSTTNNYNGTENQSAVYAMATVNIGAAITMIGGVRYQDLKTTYTASRGLQNTSSLLGGPYFHYDTTITVDHSFWLPDVILRYKPLSWFDVRLSYTSTLAYPDYRAITPRIDVSTGNAIVWNNTQLDPTRSANYDAYASFYDNTIGLFSVGGFLKRIDRLIYPTTFIVSDSNARPYYPPGLLASAPPPRGQYTVSTYVNDPVRIDNYGVELDWQTHLWYLPHPLDGLVLNINYTHVFSNSDYPYVIYIRPNRFSPLVAIDTSYRAPLLYQPNKILNLSVGYDYLGFSIRVSMVYQADIFTGIPVGVSPVWLQLHTSTSASTRWDLSVKQDMPALLSGIQLYGDLNNFSGAHDVSVIHAITGVPASEQLYGLSGDIGVRWRF